MSFRTIARRAVFELAYHSYAKARLERDDKTRILGFSVVVPPGVFHPGLYFSSKMLGRYLQRVPLEGKALLDMGCGSGILSLVAASRGAKVAAVDINPRAVEATRENADRNNLGIRAFPGNLFEPLDEGSRFEYIIFNPPFYSGEPKTEPEKAWLGGGDYRIIGDFLAFAPGFMTRSGSIILILSSEMAIPRILEIFHASGFTFECVHSKAFLFEHLFIFRARQNS